jgi:3-methylcrotonyl-CoA carboxylase alpha subunit
MDIRYRDGAQVRIERQGERFRVTIGERVYMVEVHRVSGGEVLFSADDQRFHAHIALDGSRRYVAFDSDVHLLVRAEPSRGRRAAGAGDASLAATMHGKVVAVMVGEGDTVARGQPLVILEAMKMEIRVTAPHDGRVSRLLCSPDQVVERGQPLLELSN